MARILSYFNITEKEKNGNESTGPSGLPGVDTPFEPETPGLKASPNNLRRSTILSYGPKVAFSFV